MSENEKHLSIENLTQISEIILTPLSRRMDAFDDTLKEIKIIMQKQNNFELTVAKIENDRLLCSQDCKNRIQALEKQPDKVKESFKFWIGVISTALVIFLALNTLGVINVTKKDNKVNTK